MNSGKGTALIILGIADLIIAFLSNQASDSQKGATITGYANGRESISGTIGGNPSGVEFFESLFWGCYYMWNYNDTGRYYTPGMFVGK